VLAASRVGASVHADQAWAEIAMRRLSLQIGDCLPLGNALSNLMAHDQRNGSVFAPSISSWLRNDRDTCRSADELCVHPNTLRYRLRRAVDLVGFDVRERRHRLLAELVLNERG